MMASMRTEYGWTLPAYISCVMSVRVAVVVGKEEDVHDLE